MYSEKNKFDDEQQDYWIPITPIDKMSQTDYDVLIVGSGAGGGAALWRLCEQWQKNGKRIGVVEAGPLALPTNAQNLSTFDAESVFKYWNNYIEYIGKTETSPGIVSIIAFGGKTIFWQALTPRFNPADFITWPISYSDILPYYLIAENIMNVNNSFTIGSSIQEILLSRLRARGFPDATNIPMAFDREVTKYGEVHSNVFFSSILFFAYALNYRQFDLSVNTRAIQVLTDQGKVSGIKVIAPDKRVYTLKAKTVILSAGALETPHILLLSNIPGPSIGRYLVDHPAVNVSAFARRNQFQEPLGVAGIMIPGTAERKYQLLAFSTIREFFLWYSYQERPLQHVEEFRLDGYSVVEPRFDNRVFIDPSKVDEYGIPELNFQFTYSDRDLALIQKILNELPVFASSMEVTLLERPRLRPPLWTNHVAGTCRMGNDPETSVTNQYGQIHGISNLFVADNSVLSLTSPANPTLTTIALAIRTADYIMEQMK